MVQTACFVSTENISEQEVIDHIRLFKNGLFCIVKQNSYILDNLDATATNWISQQTRELEWIEPEDRHKMAVFLGGDPIFLLSVDYDSCQSSWFLMVDLFLHFSEKWNSILCTEYVEIITRHDVINNLVKYQP